MQKSIEFVNKKQRNKRLRQNKNKLHKKQNKQQQQQAELCCLTSTRSDSLLENESTLHVQQTFIPVIIRSRENLLKVPIISDKIHKRSDCSVCGLISAFQGNATCRSNALGVVKGYVQYS